MDFRYFPRPGHLLVVATGPFDVDACRAALGEMMLLCRDHGLSDILFDARAIAELVSIGDRFDLARYVAAAQPPRMAVLVSPANAQFTKMFEETALARGALVRTTADEAEARRFLGLS